MSIVTKAFGVLANKVLPNPVLQTPVNMLRGIEETGAFPRMLDGAEKKLLESNMNAMVEHGAEQAWTQLKTGHPIKAVSTMMNTLATNVRHKETLGANTIELQKDAAGQVMLVTQKPAPKRLLRPE